MTSKLQTQRKQSPNNQISSQRRDSVGSVSAALSAKLFDEGYHDVAAVLDDFLEVKRFQNKSPAELYPMLVKCNEELKLSGLPFGKSLFTYDCSHGSEDARQDNERIVSGAYLAKKQNIALYGPKGVGKTHEAAGYGVKAVANGLMVRFIPFKDLIVHLNFDSPRGSNLTITSDYYKAELLIIDDVGSISVNAEESHLFYSLILKRRGIASTIVTTRIDFQRWARIFTGDDDLADEIRNYFLDDGCAFTLKRRSYRQPRALTRSAYELDEDDMFWQGSK